MNIYYYSCETCLRRPLCGPLLPVLLAKNLAFRTDCRVFGLMCPGKRLSSADRGAAGWTREGKNKERGLMART